MVKFLFQNPQIGQKISSLQVGMDQFLNQISRLIFGWEMSWKCNNNQPEIDFWNSNQHIWHQPNFNLILTIFQCWYFNSNSVDFWLNCGWEVDFWLIVVTCSTHFSTKYFNVEDGWGKLNLNVESVLIQCREVDLCSLG